MKITMDDAATIARLYDEHARLTGLLNATANGFVEITSKVAAGSVRIPPHLTPMVVEVIRTELAETRVRLSALGVAVYDEAA